MLNIQQFYANINNYIDNCKFWLFKNFIANIIFSPSRYSPGIQSLEKISGMDYLWVNVHVLFFSRLCKIMEFEVSHSLKAKLISLYNLPKWNYTAAQEW